jgi:hypothetical protein
VCEATKVLGVPQVEIVPTAADVDQDYLNSWVCTCVLRAVFGDVCARTCRVTAIQRL